MTAIQKSGTCLRKKESGKEKKSSLCLLQQPSFKKEPLSNPNNGESVLYKVRRYFLNAEMLFLTLARQVKFICLAPFNNEAIQDNIETRYKKTHIP